jgi:oligopeptide/dipeptide ABC transporter ATP-binding protein
MTPGDILLRARGLRVDIPIVSGVLTPVDGVSFELAAGEVLGLVGETGSGKTLTCRALLGLLPSPKSTAEGEVSYPSVESGNLLGRRAKEMRRYWGSYIAMVPQNPMTSLNPVQRIGTQVMEAVAAGHTEMSKRERRERAAALLTRVGIPAAEARLRDYPHQFSGGMLQRTLIAIALAQRPRVLIADEPTTALDVIVQNQIMELLLDLQREERLGLMLVSHDLAVVSQVCDRVAVMYGGQIVEHAATSDLLAGPRHPYTRALLESLPGAVPRDRPLATIQGSPPRPENLPETCRFAPRCVHCEPACTTWVTELLPAGPGDRLVRCRRHEDVRRMPTSDPHGAPPAACEI